MTAPEALTLDVPGGRLAALAWGPPDAPPVLALHGWLDNAASFARLAPLLPSHRLVALELPGHGHSAHRPAGVAYHFIDWVGDVVGAADALGWERFALLGHSMGAGVASLVAGTAPARVSHLALLEGLGPLACPPDEAPARLAESLARRGARERKRPRPHADVVAAAARLRQATPSLSEEGARLLAERGTRPVEGDEGGVIWRSDPRLRGLSPMRMTEEHVQAFLRRIPCPVLVIRAREGYPFDPRTLGARYGCLRQATLEELPGGHHVHLDDPAPVAALLEPFLARPTPAAAPAAAELSRPGVTLESLQVIKGIRLVLLDVDGVLTPAQLLYGPPGAERVPFDVRDGLGIKLLQRAGIEVGLLSGRAPQAVRSRAADLGIAHLHLGIDDKLPRLTQLLEGLGLEPRQVAYMGDDLPDLPVLRAVGYPVAPADARPEVQRVAHLVTGAPGGRGAVRELAEHLLKAQGKWAEVLARYGVE